MSRRYWLLKSEPDVYSIEDLEKDKITHWEGVRNYQARNLLRDEIKRGDHVFFYHSNAEPPGIAGIAEVVKEAYPDPSAFEKKSPYYDAKSKPSDPAWFVVDIKFVRKFPRVISLGELKEMKELEGMALLQKGQRLSVQPVSAGHWQAILKIIDKEKTGQ